MLQLHQINSDVPLSVVIGELGSRSLVLSEHKRSTKSIRVQENRVLGSQI